MSYLENLPQLAFIEILRFLFHQDKLNLRKTSRRLYDLTTFNDVKFKTWSFNASRGPPPDFAMESGRMFSIYIDDKDQSREVVENTSSFVKTYAERISSLSIKRVCGFGYFSKLYNDMVLLQPNWNNLKELKLYGHFINIELFQLQLQKASSLQKLQLHNTFLLDNYPFEFSNLKCLTLRHVGNMKILSAPRLEKIEIENIDKDIRIIISNQLTNLKSLSISYSGHIDLSNILSKCCQTVENLHLRNNGMLATFDQDIQFPNLRYFEYIGSGKNLIKFLSKCCKGLISLDLTLTSQVNLGSLVKKNMKLKIKTMKLELRKGTKNVVKFLNSCEDLISLKLTNCADPLFALNLPQVRTLWLIDCSTECTKALLRATWRNLRELTIQSFCEDPAAAFIVPVMNSLEIVFVTSWDIDQVTQQIVYNMFPSSTEVEYVSPFQRLVKRAVNTNTIVNDLLRAGCKRSENEERGKTTKKARMRIE